jgi:hypothetical protein
MRKKDIDLVQEDRRHLLCAGHHTRASIWFITSNICIYPKPRLRVTCLRPSSHEELESGLELGSPQRL